jgi:thiamine biosynthesis lipoprotein
LNLLVVRDRGVATSGVDYRHWRRGGSVQHHIIDPRTRRPAQTDLLSVTVIAPDATLADLHAKVALMLGSQTGYEYLSHQPAVEGLLVRNDGALVTTPGFEAYVFRD